jgi:hypothetical protein
MMEGKLRIVADGVKSSLSIYAGPVQAILSLVFLRKIGVGFKIQDFETGSYFKE